MDITLLLKNYQFGIYQNFSIPGSLDVDVLVDSACNVVDGLIPGSVLLNLIFYFDDIMMM